MARSVATARWINHSCAPNCEAEDQTGRIFIRAIRPITAGEELSIDYALIVEARHTRDRFECTNPADPPSIVRASSYACPKPWSLARARRAVLQNIRRVVGLGRRRAQRRRQRDDDKRPSFACSEHNCRPGRGARASTIRRLETSFRIIECRMWDNAALSEVSATQIGRNLFGRQNCRPFFMLRLGFVGRRSR